MEIQLKEPYRPIKTKGIDSTEKDLMQIGI